LIIAEADFDRLFLCPTTKSVDAAYGLSAIIGIEGEGRTREKVSGIPEEMARALASGAGMSQSFTER